MLPAPLRANPNPFEAPLGVPRPTLWDVSALAYSRTYDDTSHVVDAELIERLRDQLQGAVIVDCGCGPGIVTQKLAEAGAARILAVDISPAMLAQVPARPNVTPVLAAIRTDTFPALADLYEPNGFDVVLFKRSLYYRPSQALTILRDAYSTLTPGGVIAIAHPETEIARYVLNEGSRLGVHSVYHAFNRALSRVAAATGLHQYETYRRDELVRLAGRVDPDATIEVVPSSQRAFNLVLIWKRRSS